MYVWFDALTDYANVVGYATDEEKFRKWWPVVQLCGPDNLRFQAIIWQAMLASANLPFSKKILVHSTVLGPDNHKMSKTIGNVISPLEQVEKYSPEVVRYYLLAGLPTYTDAAYKEDDVINLYNANLADNYGNLVNRVIVLGKNKGIEIDQKYVAKEFKAHIDKDIEHITNLYEQYNIFEAAHIINEVVSYGNKYINDQKPWEVTLPTETINNLYYLLEQISDIYEPIIPESSRKAQEALKRHEPIILFHKIELT